jgi:hypothetical protein
MRAFIRSWVFSCGVLAREQKKAEELTDSLIRTKSATAEKKTFVVQSGMERVLDSNWLWASIIDYNYNRSANKSNQPIQNPFLFVTQTPNTWHYQNLEKGNRAYKKIRNVYCENANEGVKPRQIKKSQINPSNRPSSWWNIIIIISAV